MRCRFSRCTLTLVHRVLPIDSPKMTRCSCTACHSPSTSVSRLLTFMLRLSPRPFFRYSRVVVACAMMLPPMGFTEGPANMLPPSRLAATTWRSAN